MASAESTIVESSERETWVEVGETMEQNFRFLVSDFDVATMVEAVVTTVEDMSFWIGMRLNVKPAAVDVFE